MLVSGRVAEGEEALFDNDGEDLHVLDPSDPGAGTLHEAAVQIQTGHISVPENCRISKDTTELSFQKQIRI